MRAEMHQMRIFRIIGIGCQGLLLAKIVRSADALIQFAVLSNGTDVHTDATRKSVFDNQFLMVESVSDRVEICGNPVRVRHQRLCGTEPYAEFATIEEILLAIRLPVNWASVNSDT